MTLVSMRIDSPLGGVHIAGTTEAVTAVHLGDDDAPALPTGDTPALRIAAAQLGEYFAGARTTFALPLAPAGTEFQQRVWQALTTIPFAVTWSYGELARAIGQPTASRAVGAANGKNPLAIVVPCHRVIGTSGALVGYAGGLPIKRWLLAHEQRIAGVQTTLATLEPRV